MHALQQQLQEIKEKQKQKEESTMELHKSLECCKLLEMKKLKQLDDLIEEKKQDKEERRCRIDGNKIDDAADIRWMKRLKENAKAYNKLIKDKKKQVNALLQHIEHHKNENERQKADYEEQLNSVCQMQDQYKD